MVVEKLMKAMVLEKITRLDENNSPLKLVDLPTPQPGESEILVRVSACGVCHTELDEIEGRTPPTSLPTILGHQVVGRVERLGKNANMHSIGQRVGIGWIFDACGVCEFCLSGNENLCQNFEATGRDASGGYAEYITAPQESAFPLPTELTDFEAAPLLCAGAIGYRSLRLTGLQNGQALGLTGFGASAHLVLKTARYLYPSTRVYVFARNKSEQDFARELGANWAGSLDSEPPEKLHSIIDTTPVWKPVVSSIRNIITGGRLVINAIRKENTDREALLQIEYPTHLWMEKEIKSVANVSRRDVRDFLKIAAEVPIVPEVQLFDLSEANRALLELKSGKIRGAKVLSISP
jgi:propanol-preferring alcohol dehydrogenase